MLALLAVLLPFASGLGLRAAEAPVVGGPGPVPLSPGIPIYDTAQGFTYNYYTIQLSTVGSPTFTIDVVPYSGDPDVYVTTNGAVPSVSSYQYFSNGLGTEHIAIAPGSSGYPSSGLATINIAVQAFIGNATYTIVLFTQNSIVYLTNGSPTYDTIAPSQTRYYRLYAGVGGANVAFIASTYSAGVSPVALSMFVLASTSTTPQHPGPTQFTWSSGSNSGRRYPYINISSTDPNYCSPCYYYVGVLAPPSSSQNIDFGLVGVNGAPYIHLLTNVFQYGFANVYQYSYYQYRAMSVAKYVTITVSAQSGDPDIYVTADWTQPSIYQYQWRSSNIGSDSINITSTNPVWQTYCSGNGCNLNIAVYGYVTSTYTITVTSA